MQHYTKAVRAIMRKHGKQPVYTNKYKTTRTVKCYAVYAGNGDDTAMINEIKTELGKLNIEFVVKVTQTYRMLPKSIIVQVPMQAM